MSGPTIRFIPAPSARLAFLTPVGPQQARKVHTLKSDGTIYTASYGNAAHFTHCTRDVADICDLHGVLEVHSRQNSFAVRGQVRPDMPQVMRRLVGKTISDTPTRIVAIDIDNEPIPDAVDCEDDLAVAEFIRTRLPDELRDVSCIVELSGRYGLWRLDPATPKLAKAHVWLLNDQPMNAAEIKRWFKAESGRDCAVIDNSVSTANQPIYCGAPVFNGCADPVPQRLFLLLDANDTASIRPPVAIERPRGAPPANGIAVESPALLGAIAARMSDALNQPGIARHDVILRYGELAGGYVAGGAFTLEAAESVLIPIAVDSGSENAENTARAAIQHGMERPLYVAGDDTGEKELPPAYQYPVQQPVSLDIAETQIAEIIADVKANPRNANGLLRIAVINSTVGVGKTKIAIDQICRGNSLQTDSALWFSGTLAKADETARDFNSKAPKSGLGSFLAPPATVIRGRAAELPGGESGQVMCQKPAALKAINDAGLSRETKSLLCENEKGACEFRESCAYFAQMRVPSPVRIMTHDYLTRPTAEAVARHKAGLAIIDESPINRPLVSKTVIWSEAAKDTHLPIGVWLKTAVGRAVYAAVMDGVDLSDDAIKTLRIECEVALQMFQHEAPPVAPWQSDQSAAESIRRWQPAGEPGVMGVLLACQRWLNGETNTLWKGQSEGKPALFSRWLKMPTALRDKAAIVLDATADESIYRAAMKVADKEGEITHAVEVHSIHVANAPGTKIVQVSDQTFYKKKLLEGLPGKKLQSRIAGLAYLAGGNESIINRHGVNQSPVGLIGNKALIEAIRDKVNFEALNFNGLAGMNSLQDCKVGIVVGRTEPDALSAESMARALWPRAALNYTGKIEYQATTYPMADGSARPATVRGHADPRCDAALRYVRDAELVQSIGRFRLVRSKEGKVIYILGRTPIPGLAIDDLVTTDDLLPDWRLSAALIRGDGTVPLSADWLAENCPSEFPKPNHARLWIESFKGCFSGKYIYNPEISLSNLKFVTYTVEGQRGGKAKRAVTIAADLPTAAGRIEALTGKVVKMIKWAETETETTTAETETETETESTAPRGADLTGVFPAGFDATQVDPDPPPPPPPAAAVCVGRTRGCTGRSRSIVAPPAFDPDRVIELMALGWAAPNARARAEAESLPAWREKMREVA